MSNYFGELILPFADLRINLSLWNEGKEDPLCSVTVVSALLIEEKLAWSHGVHIVIGRTSLYIRKIPLIQVILNNQSSYTELICHLVVIQTCPYPPSGLNHSLGAQATRAVLCSGGAAWSRRTQGSSTPAPPPQALASIGAVHVTHSPIWRLKKKPHHMLVLGRAAPCGERGLRSSQQLWGRDTLLGRGKVLTGGKCPGWNTGTSCTPCPWKKERSLKYKKLRVWLGRR